MKVTSSYKRFTQRRIPDMLTKVIPGVKFAHCKELLHILPDAWALWSSLNELWMAWLPGRGYVGNHTGAARWSQHILYCVWLIFEKSSSRWRIVGKESKILLVEFFNSSEKHRVWSLHEENTWMHQQRAAIYFVYQQAISLSTVLETIYMFWYQLLRNNLYALIPIIVTSGDTPTTRSTGAA